MKLNLNGLNFCNHLFLYALMIVFTMKVTFLKCQILMFFLSWNVKNVKVDLMVNVKMARLSAKNCTEKRLNTSLKDLSLALTYHGRHGLFSF